MAKKPNVFISFQHDDLKVKEKFERMFVKHFDIATSSAVQTGKIDTDLNDEEIMRRIRNNHLRNATLTIVLIGKNTYNSKFVDWEIQYALRQKQRLKNRSGLMGIFIPEIKNGCKNYKRLLPPRLNENIKSGYAQCHDWTDDPQQLSAWVQKALSMRKMNPVNNRPLMGK